jgi:hypothetical protein
MTITAYPLAWPTGWKRTHPSQREHAKFNKKVKLHGSNWAMAEDLTIAEGTARVLAELQRMGLQRDDVVISTNLVLRLDGLPRSDQKAPEDPGVAVYWDDYGSHKVMAIDRYHRVADNLAAVAATLDAMRAIERHGGAAILDRAFTGFMALPAPPKEPAARHWRDVLGVPNTVQTEQTLKDAYRRAASAAHPDKGGTSEAMAAVNAAYAQAKQELGFE